MDATPAVPRCFSFFCGAQGRSLYTDSYFSLSLDEGHVGWFHETKATLSRSVCCDCSLRGPSDGDEAVVDTDSSLLETQRRIIYVCNLLASD